MSMPFVVKDWTAVRLKEDRAAGLPTVNGRPDVTAICYLLYEDVFFTRFLPRWQPGYARQISLAPREEAAKFAFCENEKAQNDYGKLPFGFHSWKALAYLKETFRALRN